MKTHSEKESAAGHLPNATSFSEQKLQGLEDLPMTIEN
jgi:hypothetical protein